LAGAFVSVDLVAVAVFFAAAARFGLAGASSAAGAALFRVDARLAGFGSAVPLLADLVAARRAIGCARRLAGVSSVIALSSCACLQACHLRTKSTGASKQQEGLVRHRYASGGTAIRGPDAWRIAFVHT
jgi:hypothetical protein